MAARSSPLLGFVAIFIAAPVLAVVIISTLLLVGVTPHLVFLPGFFLKARLQALGFHPPNAIGVLTTGFVWWVIVVAIWLAVRRLATERRAK